MDFSRLRVASLAILLPLIAGCGDSSLVCVQGRVTMNGRPIDRGSIRFQPLDGRGMTVGGSVSEGRYQIEMAAGPKRVEIRSSRANGEQELYPDGPSVQKMEEQIPAAYNRDSDLRIDVTSDASIHDFTLESKE